ncbi:hypothetical protein HDU96_005314, partial [Phlyctochytrium bullatum]
SATVPSVSDTITSSPANGGTPNPKPQQELSADPVKVEQQEPAVAADEPGNSKIINRKAADGGHAGAAPSTSTQVHAAGREPKPVAEPRVGDATNPSPRAKPDVDNVKERHAAPAAEPGVVGDGPGAVKPAKPKKTFKGATLGEGTTVTNPIVLRRLAMAKSKGSAPSGGSTGEAEGDMNTGSIP